MDEKDKTFLTELRKNARESLTNICRKTHIPISTLFDKLRTLQQDCIVKHTTLVDFQKLGFTCLAMVIFKVEKEDREQMRKYLCQHDHVNHVYKINNGYDFFIEVVFENVKELEEFLDGVDVRFRIIEKRPFYIIEQIAREMFMSDTWRQGK